MNSYEQKAFEMLARKLNEAGYSYEDTSWGNDATASISVTCTRMVGEEIQEFEFQVYIPNNDYYDPENEYFNCYAVTEEGGNITLDFNQVDEVIEHIQDCTSDVYFTN